MARRWRIGAAVFAIILIAGAIVLALERPSNARDWSPDQARLPLAVFDGDAVEIRNVRNAVYHSESDYEVRWETRRYDLRELDSVWYGVERFGGAGIAHTFLSFGFGDEYLAISVEVRKEKGEEYSPLRGLLRRYELMYVVADERDLIGLRTHQRDDEVILYPVRATPGRMRRAFVSMLERANALAARPEFYNTLTSTCTSNIVRHVNEIAPRRVPFSYKTLLPGYSDELAHDLGLLATDLPIAAARERFRIDDRAREKPIGPDFSARIRMP